MSRVEGGADRGSGTMLIGLVMIAVMMVAVVGAWFSGWMTSGARARSIADLVAIAAAQEQAEAGDACQMAEKAAAANGSRLIDCEVVTGWGEFVVDIAVEVDLLPSIAGAPQVVSAESRAGIVSDLR